MACSGVMKKLIVVLLTVCGLAPLGYARADQAPPNILFILTDDQGYADVGRHGNPVLETPHLDALHVQSVRFTDFCVSSSCSPTRAALLTGRYNLRVGVTHTIAPRCRPTLDAELLPQILKQAGYTTACIGKWHLGETDAHSPGQRGFDYVAGKAAHYQNGRYREDILFDEAIGFMDRAAGQPFFCYLATWSPHAPLTVPEKYVAPYRGKVDDTTAQFYGMIANIDENLGRVLRWLEEKDLARDTVVVFMSDNGGTHGVDTFNAGMRGCKCTAWPGGTRAVSFWRWPGKWAARDVDALTAHVDVLPTLTALAGASSSDPAPDGRSLLPLLEGRDDPWFADRMVFQHNARWASGLAARHKDSMAGVRWRDYLLVRSRPCDDPACLTSGVSQCAALTAVGRGATTATYTKNAQFIWGLTPGDGWALYDVRKDPGCQQDLAAARFDVTRRLAGAYDRWWGEIYPEMIAGGGDASLSQAALQKAKNRRKE
jgi:arylsulfatase A-like enzyme